MANDKLAFLYGCFGFPCMECIFYRCVARGHRDGKLRHEGLRTLLLCSGPAKHQGTKPNLRPTGCHRHSAHLHPGAVAEPAQPLAPGLSAQPRHLFTKLPSLCSTWEENGPYREAICSLTKPFRLVAVPTDPHCRRQGRLCARLA